jgi:integrase
MALTLKKVAKLINAGERVRILDSQGLYLIVNGSKSAHWERRYELNHKAHWLGLGSARVFTLDEARQRNREISKLLADDIDPLQKRQEERARRVATAIKARTFRECALEYIEKHEREWKSPIHLKQWHSTLGRYAFPKIGNLPVEAIDKSAVLAVLEQPVIGGSFWNQLTVTADRLRNRIELVLNLATAAGYRPEGGNPASWDVLKELLPAPSKTVKVNHHAALKYVDVPAFISELRQRDGIAPKALEFAILTAARPGESVGATWDEIDLDAATWTIAPERMKAEREHRVPLSPRAVELLRSLPTETGNPHLFIGTRTGRITASTVAKLLKGINSEVTVHGFRSSFSDWAHERTAFSNHVIELSLAHSVGSDVEKAYRRGDLFDKRRKLMEAWATYCNTPTRNADVVPMRKA